MATYLEVELTVSLPAPAGRAERELRAYTYYFVVPDAWAYMIDDELQLRAFDVAERMYAELERRTRADIKATSARARMLSAAEVAAQPWRTAAVPPWERTPRVAVNPDGSFRRER